MTDRQLVTKLIEKAEKTGWGFQEFYRNNIADLGSPYETQIMVIERNIELLIFDHGWAAAFWNKEEHKFEFSLLGGRSDPSICIKCGEERATRFCWQYHLQQISILSKKDRKEYLKKFI